MDDELQTIDGALVNPGRAVTTPSGVEAPQDVDPNEPIIVSGATGVDRVQEDVDRLGELTQAQREAIERVREEFGQKEEEPDMAARTAAGERIEPLKLMDVESGQEVNFQFPDLNRENIQSFLDRDFEVVEGSLPAGISVKREGETAEETSERTQIETQLAQASNELADASRQIEAFRTRVEEQTESLVDSIKERYRVRREDLIDINKRRLQHQERLNIRLGIARYASAISSSFLAEEERQGIKRIQELDAAERAEIANAHRAAQEQDFELLSLSIENAEKHREEMLEQIQKLNQKAIEQAESITEEKKRLETENAISEAVFNQNLTERDDIFRVVNFNVRGARIRDISPEKIDDFLSTLAIESEEIVKGELVESLSNRLGVSKRNVSKAAFHAGMSLDDFSGLDDVVQRQFIFGDFDTEELSEDEKRERADAQTSAFANLNLINTILNSDYLSAITGGIFRNLTAIGVSKSEIKAQITRLDSILALENRDLLKGQGTISDFEAKILATASDALNVQEDGTIKMTDEAAERELRRIRGVFRHATGVTTPVQVTDPLDGDTELFERVTREDVNQFIADGLLVEYK